MKEGILHQVPRLIKLFVVLTPLSAILFRRNDRHHTLALRLIKNRVRVISLSASKLSAVKPSIRATA